MIDTVIVSGGDIQSDFALDFLKKNAEKAGKEKIRLIAADRGHTLLFSFSLYFYCYLLFPSNLYIFQKTLVILLSSYKHQ